MPKGDVETVYVDGSDVGEALAAAARTMKRGHSLEENLQQIVDAARHTVTGFDQVGISTVHRGGKVETKACTGDLVLDLDAVQYGLGEGPCVDSLREAAVVVAPTLRHDQRWPRYVPKAVQRGVRAQLAVKLYLDDEGTLGGINFYSTTTEDVDPDAGHIAELFAAHAAVALGYARDVDNLNQALRNRQLIGQAIGILMERYELTEERATAFLVRASSHGNTKLREIAKELVDERNSARPS